MKDINIISRFSIWSAFAVALVLGGGLLARNGIAQEQPLLMTGRDVKPAHLSSGIKQTEKQMRAIYDIMKSDNWSRRNVPANLTQFADQQLDERAYRRNKNIGGFFFPNLSLYSDVAIWTDTYFRQNIAIYKSHVTSHPEGFYLVMYKDGSIRHIAPDEVRLYPHPTDPDGMVPVFPGMKVYKASLPKLPNYQ